MVKGLVTSLPSSSGTGIGGGDIPAAPETEVGHGTGTGAEEVPVAPRPSTEDLPEYGTGTGDVDVPVAPSSGGGPDSRVSKAVVEETAEEIDQAVASDSEEEQRDLELIPAKGDKGKGKAGGSF